MAEDLTTKITRTSDSAEFLPGNGARPTTIIQFFLGKFGPFEAVLDREHTQQDIRDAIEKRRQTLIGLV